MMKHLLCLACYLVLAQLVMGQTWEIFNTSNSSMLEDHVTAIEPGFGLVHVATEGGGISSFDGSNWTNIDTSLMEHSCTITDMALASPNDLWVTTQGICGLKRIVNDQLVFDSLIFNYSLSSVEVDGQGTAWVGNNTNGGLYEFVGNGFIVHDETNSDNPNDYVWGISIINDSTRWVVGTHEVGLMADSGWTIFDYLQNPYPLWWDVVADGSESAWFATNLGLVHYDGADWTVYDDSNSGMPASGGIADFPHLTIDQNGVVWMASFSGLIKFDGTDFTVYNTGNSDLPSNMVTVVEVDSANNVWVGTDNGLVRIVQQDPSGVGTMDESEFKVFPIPAENVLNVAGLPQNSSGSMQIMDVTGKQIRTTGLSRSVDTSELPSGCYFLRIETGQRIQTLPFVKR